MGTVEVSSDNSKKGRSFRAEMMAVVRFDSLVDEKSRNVFRPLFAVFGASHGEASAFIANVRTGREVKISSHTRCEFLRSLGYATITQRTTEGVIYTVYLPQLFRHDPGMVDEHGIRFVLLPTREQLGLPANNDADFGLYEKEEWAKKHERRYATLFASFLDRRTRAPILCDPAFQAQLLRACIAEGLAIWPRDSHSHSEEGCLSLGFGLPLMFRAKHARFEQLLTEQTQAFFANKQVA